MTREHKSFTVYKPTDGIITQPEVANIELSSDMVTLSILHYLHVFFLCTRLYQPTLLY